MVAIRSFLFLILFYAHMTFMCLILLPFLLFPQTVFRHAARFWLGSCLFLAKYVAGIDYKVTGTENIPEGSVIIAAKHQSAWETIAMHFLHFDSAYVLKKELVSIPLFGLYLSKMNCVAVDRKAGASALKDMVAQAQIVLNMHRSLIIFPQGTRTSPGEDKPYHPGIAALYTQNNVPVVPVALNSGQFWGKNAFKKTPGEITVKYLEPIQPGLPRREFMATLKERIDTATGKIEAEVIEKRGF